MSPEKGLVEEAVELESAKEKAVPEVSELALYVNPVVVVPVKLWVQVLVVWLSVRSTLRSRGFSMSGKSIQFEQPKFVTEAMVTVTKSWKVNVEEG